MESEAVDLATASATQRERALDLFVFDLRFFGRS